MTNKNNSDDIKNILLVCNTYLPNLGGAERHLQALCDGFCAEKKNVVLYVIGNDTPEIREFDKAQPYTIIRDNVIQGPCRQLRSAFHFRKNVLRFISEYQIDIINITTAYAYPLLLRFRRSIHIPVIFTAHNVPPEECGLKRRDESRLIKILEKIYFKVLKIYVRTVIRVGRYDSIISVSEVTKEKLIANGAKKEDVTIIPNGVPLPKPVRISEDPISQKYSSRFVLMTTAGIIKHKGQLELVNAVEMLIPSIPNIVSILVGPTRSEEYLNEIKEYIAAHNLEEHVILTGPLSNDELERYFSICDVYIQPSYEEGFCIAIMEGMIRKIPAIGTSVGAIPELMSDGKGILISKPNPKEIADAVLKYYSDVDFRNRCALAGYEYVLNTYSSKRMVDDTLKHYEHIIATIVNDKGDTNTR